MLHSLVAETQHHSMLIGDACESCCQIYMRHALTSKTVNGQPSPHVGGAEGGLL